MIANTIAAIVLTARMLSVFPHADPVRAFAAARAAIATPSLPPELLVAIAEHESDLEPNAVSYVQAGHRVDVLWDGRAGLPHAVVCGYLSAMATPNACAVMIAEDGGMGAGARELALWLGTCRGDLRCALRGHAGGTACAVRSLCSPAAATFARIFYSRAVALGMEDRWKPERAAAATMRNGPRRSERRRAPVALDVADSR